MAGTMPDEFVRDLERLTDNLYGQADTSSSAGAEFRRTAADIVHQAAEAVLSGARFDNAAVQALGELAFQAFGTQARPLRRRVFAEVADKLVDAVERQYTRKA